MKKMFNSVRLEGYLYEHDLKARVTGETSKTPGTNYISGSIGIATDDDCLNVVTVYYSYVTETTKKGEPNATYTLLKNIIDGKLGLVMRDGKEKANKVRVDTSLALNDFYTDRNGQEELVSAKRNEGGFIHLTDVLASVDTEETKYARNNFTCDMLITRVTEKEANEEKNEPAKVLVRGAIFNFRNDLLPYEFSVEDEAGMTYFLNLDASDKNPIFTKVKGTQVANTVVRKIEEASAFGAPSVREVRNTRKDMLLVWASPDTYVWDDESTITATELTEAMANRETYLATIKKRNDDYKASKASPVAAPAAGGFNF